MLEDIEHLLGNLSMVWEPRGIHPTRNIDSVPPDIVLRFPGSDNPGDHGTDIHSNPEHEVLVTVFVQVCQFLPESKNKLSELS